MVRLIARSKTWHKLTVSMYKQFILCCILFANTGSVSAQNKTDVSLFLRKDSSVYLDKIASLNGDLFYDVGHHGPAIENVAGPTDLF